MPVCNFNPASEEYADFIVSHNNLSLEQILEENNAECGDYVDTQFAIVYAPLKDRLPITIEKYSYTAIPKLYALLDTTSMEASGITQTFQQPNLNLRGEGTMVGLIDTGIEYQNPLFRNPDGSSRILGIWDQTINSDNGFGVPETYSYASLSYGREFTKAQIDSALLSDDPYSIVPSRDESGHGTFMAGIAAGSTSPSMDFTGAAPSCTIGIVKLKPAKQYLRDFYHILDSAEAFQENDIMLGIKYLSYLAYTNGLPLVIYIGLGTNYGSHDGSSPLGLTLNGLSRFIGLSAVLPAGNEAGLRHHYMGRLTMNQEYDDVEIRVAPDEQGFAVELWATEPELYTVGFVSPAGEVISRLPISLGAEIQVTFVLEPTVITVNYRTSEVGSGSQFIVMRFLNPTAGIWHIRVYNSLFISGIFHMWLPVEGFIKEGTYFLKSDPDTTITEPANAATPITVSTYNHVNDSIYIHSSRGYARSGLVKPDLAAPGVNVFGPGLSPAADSNEFPMTRRTGSSVAAAHVAGAIADLFTWGIVRGNDLAMSDASVRAYLIRGADRNPAYTYPNGECKLIQLYVLHIKLRILYDVTIPIIYKQRFCTRVLVSKQLPGCEPRQPQALFLCVV